MVPSEWPEAGAESSLSSEPFPVVQLPVRRGGDVNRHEHHDIRVARRLLAETGADVLDIHEEPYSLAARAWLRAAPFEMPVVMYTAQNVDKRYPPPFFGYERAAYARVDAFYPCSRQAASVLRGKGFTRRIEVLPLGYDHAAFWPSQQPPQFEEIILLFAARLVPEKGALDAVRTLARLLAVRPARLVISGSGPDEQRIRDLATSLRIMDRLTFTGWQSGEALAASYRHAHFVLVPSLCAEQFGRAIVEAQASGALVAGYASGAIPEVAGPHAVLVPAGDALQLADAIARVASHPVDYAKRQIAGVRRAEAQTWEALAARQVALYRHAQSERAQRIRRAHSPKRRRSAARAEFGPPAVTPGGERPFALPYLRRGGVVAGALATVIDGAAEIAARARAATT